MVLVTSLKVIDGESGVSVLKIYRNTVLIKALASAGNFQIKKNPDERLSVCRIIWLSFFSD